jgi:hypothetical protein
MQPSTQTHAGHVFPPSMAEDRIFPLAAKRHKFMVYTLNTKSIQTHKMISLMPHPLQDPEHAYQPQVNHIL